MAWITNNDKQEIYFTVLSYPQSVTLQEFNESLWPFWEQKILATLMCCICELIRQNIQWSLNFWLLSTLPSIIFIPLFSDLGLENSGRTWQNFRLCLLFRAVVETFPWCLWESGGLFRIFCFTQRRMRSLSPSWRVQGQIPTPDWSLENYSLFSFLEAGQLQPLLLPILQMDSFLVVSETADTRYHSVDWFDALISLITQVF